ncbi:MAG: DUF1566 domain-containing protein [Thermoanaerobaculia bacterium]
MTNAASAKKEVHVSVTEEQGIVTIGNATVEVSADGKTVTCYTTDGVETKAAATPTASAEGTTISISKDFNAVVLNGVTIEQAADGHLVITAPGGTVLNKPAPANDTSVAALKLGMAMTDGSIFAGLTADGKQYILAMPTDLDVTMTFNDAAKAVNRLNATKTLGHDDWQIPSLENLRVLQKNQNEGALKGTFNTASPNGPTFPGEYWSTTGYTGSYNLSCFTHDVRFADAGENFFHKDNFRLSCRPVRLVAASAAPAPGAPAAANTSAPAAGMQQPKTP